jgi:hypothetical protein
MRHSRGTGSTEVYDADIDALWKVIPKAVAESGLIVAGDNKDEGYVLAEKIEWTVKKVFLGSDQRRATVDRAVIFVKPHNRGTLVEVIATGSTSSGIDYALASGAGNETNHDRELSILRTIGRLLQVQTRESNPD